MFTGEGRGKTILVLEDGTVFEGSSVGASGEFYGEVCFNTSMTGYQEILTDPSYAGQMVTMTYPLIGNYGVNPEDFESDNVYMGGFLVREMSRAYSNWRAAGGLDEFLASRGVVGIEGIDTRKLTRHIRTRGAMKGGLSSVDLDPESVHRKVLESPGLVGVDLVKGVSVTQPYVWEGGLETEPEFEVVAFDYGIKRNILRLLNRHSCRVTVVPADTGVEEIMRIDPHGVFLSNGPGDPDAVGYAIQSVRELLGKKPVFGICLGHQILGLALGGATYKLKFGHRGANQPVMDLETGKVEITAQNHGFAVDTDSLSGCQHGEVTVTHVNLNDDTVEGLSCPEAGAFSVQYHPEASPGPHDSRYLFDRFVKNMKDSG